MTPCPHLETRTCAGGCGLTFRCLPTSSQRRARAECGPYCGTPTHANFHVFHGAKGSRAGRKPKELSVEQRQRFDAVLALAAARLEAGNPTTLTGAAADLGIATSKWRVLRERVRRLDPIRMEAAKRLVRRLAAAGLGHQLNNHETRTFHAPSSAEAAESLRPDRDHRDVWELPRAARA